MPSTTVESTAGQQRPPREYRWLWHGLGGLLSLTLVVVGGGLLWYNQQLEPVSSDSSEQVVTIEPGTSATEISVQLEQAQLVRSSTAFDVYARRSGQRDRLQAGTYRIKPSYSTPQILTQLAEGRTAKHRLTIIEGDTLGRIKQRLIEDGYTETQLTNLFDRSQYSSDVLQYLPIGVSLEGYVFPETYQSGYLQPPQALIELGLQQLQTRLSQELLDGFKRQRLSVHQAMTLASIIEREATADEGERRQIAQVFLKRLAEGEPLGADITACYAAELAGEIEPGVGCDTVPLDIKSPYNTRLPGNDGLPPGPIGAPGSSALSAVANPANTDYLFYFHDDQGQARFSKTYQQHVDKIDRFCQQNCG